MNINWILRFKNKVTLTTLVVAIIALVYQVLGLCGVVPAVSQSDVVNVAGAIINILVLLGIVVDPTTQGASDSDQALGYEEPKRIEE